MEMQIVKMASPERVGWQRSPLRFAVIGSRSECQKFSTLKMAERYCRARKSALSEVEAIKEYARLTHR